MKENKSNKRKDPNRQYISLIVMLLMMTVVLFASSYSFFQYQRSGKKQNIMQTANLNIVIDDNGNLGINQQNSFPAYDEVGRQNDPYKFTLKNIGSVAANYQLKLVPDNKAIEEDGCQENLLEEKSIKFQLIKDGVVLKEDTIASLTDYVIDAGFIGLVEGVNAYDYELRLWISSEAGKEVMGRHYHGRIDVEIIDPANS